MKKDMDREVMELEYRLERIAKKYLPVGTIIAACVCGNGYIKVSAVWRGKEFEFNYITEMIDDILKEIKKVSGYIYKHDGISIEAHNFCTDAIDLVIELRFKSTNKKVSGE